MLAQFFGTVLAAPPHMRSVLLPNLPDSCFPEYRTGASGAPEYSIKQIGGLDLHNNNDVFALKIALILKSFFSKEFNEALDKHQLEKGKT